MLRIAVDIMFMSQGASALNNKLMLEGTIL